MSDVYREPTGNYGIATYLDGGEVIDKARNLLAGLSDSSGVSLADRAIWASMRRAATSGEALGAKEVKKDYYVASADFKKYAHTKWHIFSESGSTELTIEFFGYHIPLIRFDTKFGKDGRVETHVKRSSPKAVLDHAFVSEVKSGHIGLFERETDDRLPIRQLLGPAIPQMIDANDGLKERIGEKLIETFNKRLEHEIDFRLGKLLKAAEGGSEK